MPDRTCTDRDAAIEARWARDLALTVESERAFRAEIRPPCTDGRHRPDDDPAPGDRCKDCGRELTWRGPGPNDWDVADPLTGAEREELAEAFADYRSRTGGHVDPQDDEPEPGLLGKLAGIYAAGIAPGLAAADRLMSCICGPNSTGEAPDVRPDCPAHGTEPAEPEATRYWLGTCPKDGVHIGIKTEGSDPDVPLVMRARDSVDSTCLCGTTLALRLVTRAEYEDVHGPDDDEDEPDGDAPLLEDADGAPYPDEVQRAHRLALADARQDAAVSALRKHARLLRRLADDDDGSGTSAAGLTDAAQETDDRADAIEDGRLAP